VHSVSVNLEPNQFLAGWRADAGALFLPALSDSRIGDVVAVRLGIYGKTIRATVLGKVSSVRRVGRPTLPPGIEITLDRASLPAAHFLAMAARGEQVAFRDRAARFSAERRFVLVHQGSPVDATTLNLSEGGLALRWPGPLPAVGDLVGIRLGQGLFFPPVARAVVCWTQPGGSVERSVGLRVIPEGRAVRAWRSLVAEIARSGAAAA
jgi:hypothetical protein